MPIAYIKKSLGLKVSLVLAGLTLVLTMAVAAFITQQQGQLMEEMTIDKARVSARAAAQAYGQILEEGIDNNYLTVQDVFDTNYREIPGFEWGERKKYHTRYDFYTDRTVMELQDRIKENPDIIAAIGMDMNGYIPTHNGVYMQPITGDAKKDLEGNRTKRIVKYKEAEAAAKNVGPILVQPYYRDTGELTWDVSAPVFVKGTHWGCFRIVVSVARIEAQKSALLVQMVVLFLGFAVVAAALIFLMLRRALMPLVRLTSRADAISVGEDMDEPIKAASTDEVGRMAKSVERLRSSLKAAMARLGE